MGAVKLKVEGKDIFRIPVEAPPKTKFEMAQLQADVADLMRRYGLRRLTAELQEAP